jgi:hypothetical protein
MKDFKKKLAHPASLLAMVTIVFIAWKLWPNIVNQMGLGIIPDKANELGDMYGGLNTLFTGITLCAVGYTILLQHIQLDEARAALQAEQKQREATEKSHRVASFENTFFLLLEHHKKIVNDIRISYFRPKQGIEALQAFNTIISEQLTDLRPASLKNKGPLDLGDFRKIYTTRFQEHDGMVAHYFRSLYQIMKFIDRNPDEATRITYAKLFRAQLSNFELVALAFNGASEQGQNFKPLIDQYGLLEHLPSGLEGILDGPLCNVYNASAFRDPAP